MVIKKILTFLILLLHLSSFSQELNVIINKNPALTNEIITLQYTIKAKGNDFRPPSLSNFHILSGPSQGFSQSYSNQNGKTTREIKTTISYSIQAKKVGTFIIPSASVKVNGKIIKSKVLKVKVEKGTETNDNNLTNVYIKLVTNKSEIFVGEQISSISKIYIKNGTNIQNSNILPITYNGFWEDEVKVNTNKQKREIIDGVAYTSIKFRHSILTSQKSGELHIPSSEMDVSIPKRGRLISNHPFFGPQYETILSSINLSSKPKTIKVKKLPLPIPTNFHGTVSENFTIKTTVDKTTLKTSEAISFKVIFRGEGNINLLEPFDIPFPDAFEVFEPTIRDKTFTGNYNTSGTKTFEYILIARQVGNFEIDEINFTYLNPKTGKYQNIKSEKYSFKIEKGKQYFPIDSTQINQQKIELLEFNGGSKISNRILIYHWFPKLFWGGILIILIIYLTSFIQNKRNSNPEHTKRRKSTKIAIKRLKNAQICLNNNDFDVFFEEIEKSIWGYLTDKFGVKSAELSKENIDIHFNNNNIDNDFKNKFIEVLNVCELARYSPTQDQNKKMQEILNNAKEIIIKIESNLSKK